MPNVYKEPSPSPDSRPAVIQLKPFVTLTFLAHVAYYMRKLFDQDSPQSKEPPPHIEGQAPWSDQLKALHLAIQLFGEAARSGAALTIVLTGWHLLVIERRPSTQARDMKFHIHLLVLAQPAPTPSSEPTGTTEAAYCSLWTISTVRSLPAALVLLAVMADKLHDQVHAGMPEPPSAELRTPFPPFDPGEPPAPSDEEEAPQVGEGSTKKRSAPQAAAAKKRAVSLADSGAAKQVPVAAAYRVSLRGTHSLLRQSRAFASGLRSKAYQACLVPSAEAWNGCFDLGIFKRHPLSPCSDASHQRAVAKGPRRHTSEESDEEIDVTVSQRHLEREGKTYEALKHLQGRSLAKFYGRWGGRHTHYLYEDVGTSVSGARRCTITFP